MQEHHLADRLQNEWADAPILDNLQIFPSFTSDGFIITRVYFYYFKPELRLKLRLGKGEKQNKGFPIPFPLQGKNKFIFSQNIPTERL